LPRAMKELDDIDALAAEYVLGTLDAAERREVAERRQREPALERAIGAWERRLGPMIHSVKPVRPPLDIFGRVRSQIGNSRELVELRGRELTLRRQVRGWRAATAAVAAMAASIVGYFGYQEATRPAMPKTYVAMLKNDAASPQFLLTVDLDTKMFTIRPVTAGKPSGKSYELWLVHDKLKAPRSLGLVVDDMKIRPELARYDPDMFMDATFAVSLEPEGGSPSGEPTGPVLFSGKLMQTTP